MTSILREIENRGVSAVTAMAHPRAAVDDGDAAGNGDGDGVLSEIFEREGDG